MGNTTYQYDSSTEKPTRALLVTLQDESTGKQQAVYRSEELESLVRTMGLDVIQSQVIRLREINPAYLIGTGKMEEIVTLADDLEIECIVFDSDLSPSQQRNWESCTRIAVIDRREVILQIFADRASTREAVLQAALAQQEYSMPRLTRAWSHLSRQRGGTRGTRGEGETQLEIDRRLAMQKIAHLKRELKKVQAHRSTQRKQRRSLPVPTGSIVGYTNAGKSSLLHALTDADVLVEDKLFATLDPTTRRIELSGGTEVLLTDTVGFVQNLPHDLVDAFRSTLEETQYSDFIIHVIDVNHPDVQQCYNTTMEVLDSLKCLDKPMILVCNKIDLVDDFFNINVITEKHEQVIRMSVINGTGFDALFDAIREILYRIYPLVTYRLPIDRYDIVALMRRNGTVASEKYENETILVRAQLPERLSRSLQEFAVYPGAALKKTNSQDNHLMSSQSNS